MTAVELKDQGNRLFAMKKFDAAISCYTKAIIKSPNTPTFFTNRALCHLKLKQWEQAIQDCRQALDMERSLLKAHFFMGQALVELGYYDESIASLKRAHDLAKEQKMNFGDDIASALRSAKKKRWNVLEEKRIQQEIALQTYLNKLIKEEMVRQQDLARQIYKDEDCTEEIEDIEQKHTLHLAEVNALFSSLDERRKKREVPDYLCGRISFELMREPVITPSGITYDKKDVVEHLHRVGHFDPVTRTTLTEDNLIPNLAMKEVIDAFLEENPWGEDY